MIKEKHKRYYNLILFIAIALTSCNNSEKEYYPEGNIRFKYYPKLGWFFEYYENGKMKKVLRSINEVPNGSCLTFYDNGNVMTSATFQNGKAIGYFAMYYPTGGLKKELYFKDGVMSGIFKSYYENGKLNSNGFLENDSLIYFKKYDENGSIENIFRAFTVEMNDTIEKNSAINITISEKGPVFSNSFNLLSLDFILNSGDTVRYYRAFSIQKLVSDVTIEEVASNTKRILFSISEPDINSRKSFETWLTKDVTVK